MDITKLKLSELIHVGLRDLELCEKDPEYEVYMGTWHEPFDFEPTPGCYVCLAGAVMAQSLNTNIVDNCSPEAFSLQVSRALRALNLLREGEPALAVAILSSGHIAVYPDDPIATGPLASRDIISYTISPQIFKAEMIELADDLEHAGY